MRKLGWVLVAVAMTAVVGSACTTKPAVGDAAHDDASTSSSSSTSTSSTSTTAAANPKVTFLAQGNAICADMNTRSEAVGTVVDDPNATPDQIADAFDQTVGIVNEAVAGLRALSQPPGDEAKLAAMYADVDALTATTSAFASALRSGDQTTARALAQQLDETQDKANAEFNDYGLVQCGS